MHIEKIKLENFKAFKYIEYKCNQIFNVIVGENNIGKSTLFEALNLWKFAYDNLIQERNKNKFCKAASNYYIPFSDLIQIRLVNDDDIFYDIRNGSTSITLTIKEEADSFSLKIRFEKPGIKNSYLRIFNDDGFEEFEEFAEHIENKDCSLKNALFMYQTRPISTIYKNEPFYNNAQIEKKISIGKSHDVLRNKILKTEDSQAKVAQRFSRLEDRLERVLKNKYSIRFKNKNRIDDEYVKITAESSIDKKELEISMMGSGFLQVIEIFSTIEYIEKQSDGICLILIDEPDSHIHSDLQSHLIDELKKHDEIGKGDLVGLKFNEHDESDSCFLGFDLIDRYCDVSLLTNWGNDVEIINRLLSPSGLVLSLQSINEIQQELLQTSGNDAHVEGCQIVSIYRPSGSY